MLNAFSEPEPSDIVELCGLAATERYGHTLFFREDRCLSAGLRTRETHGPQR